MNAGGRDYERVAALIRHLRAHAEGQPSLAELAALVGLSEFHLQRLFAEWAGVSPKRFLQCLTKEHAKEVLRRNANVLDAAFAAGLSGPGRLHDLLVSCDAVSPGEVGARGEGLRIGWGVAPTPFGAALIAVTPRGVCRVEFVDGADPAAIAAAAAQLQREWPRAELVADAAAAAEVAGRMFPDPAAAGSGPPSLHLLLRGTNFQIQVWQALLRLPAGALTTYGAIARATGHPGAARAVGNAVGHNALAVLIPCHRVILESGDFGGYRWGSERKRALIGREAAQRAP